MCILTLVLDDDRNRHNYFRDRFNDSDKKFIADHVLTAEQCIEAIKKKKYVLIFLDHDLSGEVFVDVNRKDTGSEVARWISKNPDRIENCKVFIHSFNEEGANHMAGLIPNSTKAPAAWLESNFKLLEF